MSYRLLSTMAGPINIKEPKLWLELIANGFLDSGTTFSQKC